jgi:hypothetical protein
MPPFSIFSLAAILVGSRDHRTQFWKGAIQGSFHKSLVAIGPVVSEEKILWEFPIGSYVKLSSAVGAILIEGPNRRTHFWKRTIQWLFHQNVVLIEWANGFRLLSQKVPKFELYKHNDELFNIYYGIFYELWNFADFDRFCKLEKRGMKLK